MDVKFIFYAHLLIKIIINQDQYYSQPITDGYLQKWTVIYVLYNIYSSDFETFHYRCKILANRSKTILYNRQIFIFYDCSLCIGFTLLPSVKFYSIVLKSLINY